MLFCSLVSIFAIKSISMHQPFTINVQGKLLVLDKPVVMGILNATSDSFFSSSRVAGASVVERARKMLDDGAAILDVGACSTRPGSVPVSAAEELRSLHAVLEKLDKEFPAAVVSVDTFRGEVALECARNHNVSIINDVSGFEWDSAMFNAVVQLKKTYVLTHSMGCAGDVAEYTDFIPEVLGKLARKMWQLHQEGVADVIVDPGFGFGKSLEQNFMMLAALREFAMLDAPLLVGVSRKSMITRLLGVSAQDALPGTVALNMAALLNGASILRVHDVKEAVQAVRLSQALKGDLKEL